MAGALLSTRGWRHDAGIEPREGVVRAVVGPDLSDRQSTIGALPAIDVVDAVNRRRRLSLVVRTSDAECRRYCCPEGLREVGALCTTITRRSFLSGCV
jgi:hypothetical protein